MLRRDIKTTEYLSYPPRHNPMANKCFPWSIDYDDAVTFGGKKVKCGTRFFSTEEKAYAWARDIDGDYGRGAAGGF